MEISTKLRAAITILVTVLLLLTLARSLAHRTTPEGPLPVRTVP